jgi:hypothetical protein
MPIPSENDETGQLFIPQAFCPYCKSSDFCNEDGPNDFGMIEMACHAYDCGRRWTEPRVDLDVFRKRIVQCYEAGNGENRPTDGFEKFGNMTPQELLTEVASGNWDPIVEELEGHSED